MCRRRDGRYIRRALRGRGTLAGLTSSKEEAEMKVGFIGVGMMGAGMASNMQKGGNELVVNDLTRQAASRHLADGATWAETPRAVAEACDVIFTSLPTPADVVQVGNGPN